jgi:hypothetical protein
MQSWKSLRLTSHTWLGLNPQIGRPLSRIVVPLVYFFLISLWRVQKLCLTTPVLHWGAIFTRRLNLAFCPNHSADMISPPVQLHPWFLGLEAHRPFISFSSVFKPYSSYRTGYRWCAAVARIMRG